MNEYAEADTAELEKQLEAAERQRRIDELILNPDMHEVAKCHDTDDFGALLYNVWNDREHLINEQVIRMVKSWAQWEVDRK